MMSGQAILLTRNEAVQRFRSSVPALNSEPKSPLERDLRRDGIAQIKLDIAKTAFQELSDKYAVCIENHGIFLDWTAGNFDKDRIPENGHISKNLKFNGAGMQTVDPKNLFHFNNRLQARWNFATQTTMPSEFREFMEDGFELKHELTKSARILIAIVAESYEGLNELVFPGDLSATTLRLLRYDGYKTRNDEGKLIVERNAQVAKAHYDRGTATIQAYASDAGFWRQPDDRRGAKYDKFYPPHGMDQSQLFFGEGFRAVYGSHANPIKPLYHGVDRIFDEGIEYVSPRTAVILFIDSPLFNLGIKGHETQPERLDRENLDV